MNSVFVICEIEEGKVADVSLELLTKGRQLANQLKTKLEAVVIGKDLKGIENQIFPYGTDVVYKAEDKRLEHYLTLPYTSIITDLFKETKPEIALLGATSQGRDLGPRVSSKLKSGLTADCTSLEIGPHEDKKAGKTYEQLLYQIRPAFGGNIIATIINPEHRPQMATVREGVMKKEIVDTAYKGEVKNIDVSKSLKDEDFVISIVERHMEKRKVNLTGSQVIIAGGYGMGSPENFNLLYDLAEVLGGEVAASRAAVDAGFADHARQVGQTGVTVRPKIYIACGISGQIQHRAGMENSSMIIAVNTDENAPINQIADYVINGDVAEIIPRMIKAYKKNTK
ncbi:MAG TPA: electron transfer flavoprotein subunit alpha/FixB family protein [Salinivirga sp.]|uniref:electron transfer flavoprotein subunit alpha/FixB family protein n=1 Tax=Salinivirga sp. TaxID=1970192 RepID=UPI002B45C6F6|nr:electron transfer flavoprotein subunit alpha/FixB family protein [Salinivirga sp.]HKK59498.1 electron transfer flavoprotein subunit alpha/FixB family protein [Salinivirga sp.]